jgi:hypothetical protein
MRTAFSPSWPTSVSVARAPPRSPGHGMRFAKFSWIARLKSSYTPQARTLQAQRSPRLPRTSLSALTHEPGKQPPTDAKQRQQQQQPRAQPPPRSQATPHDPHPKNDCVARRADSCSPSSPFMRHRVRRRWREWERIGARGKVLSWICHGVRVKFKHGARPRPFNHGTSILDVTQAQLDFLDAELPCFEACRAWERSHNPRYVSRIFLVPKPGHNQWCLTIDLRELNRYCSTFTMTCETMKHLRHLSRPGDNFVSLDLTDGYCTLGIREEDRDYFTVNYRGAMWRLACLPLGWPGSAYYLCKLTHVFTNHLRRPPPHVPASTPASVRPSKGCSETPGGAVPDCSPTWTTFCFWRIPTTPRCSFANASNPNSSN